MATFGLPESNCDDESTNKKTNRKEWKTLKEAREERPLTANSNISVKASLPPKKELDKSRSKSRFSGRSSSFVDNSP